MTLIFTGFLQANSVRQFAFDRVADDRSRTQVTVRADLALARKHDILMQDLPLLCRRLLEMTDTEGTASAVVFTEANMVDVQTMARNAKADKRAARTHTPSPRTGHAWRTTPGN